MKYKQKVLLLLPEVEYVLNSKVSISSKCIRDYGLALGVPDL